MKSVCVFCGSSERVGKVYRSAARRLGAGLAERGIDIVYGGGAEGLMGVLAKAALAAGGRVIGVLPEQLAEKEGALPGLTTLHITSDLPSRKKLMAELAEGFIALPGGYGTLEELLTVVSWAELGLHNKPCGLLDTADYYQLFLDFLDDAVAAGFLKRKSRNLLYVEQKPEELIEALCSRPPTSP